MTLQSDRLSAALSGRYRIERELGAGGMATVYLAFDEKHDRKVAIKVLKPELAAVLGAERFVVEIKTTAAMSHPHILPLFDSGTADGFLFYVMPYIQGETIREKLNRETQFGVDEAVRIAREVADALDYAHRHGVIHRDIKPENILLHDGRAMVMDFGIALAVSAAAGGRMTETGLSLGTPHYMSPEQATAEKEITARSDQYSLASVLYEMLTGNAPFTGAAAQQIIMKIITEPAEPVSKYRKAVPTNVAATVAKALEKLPADRFDSAKAFAEALGNAGFAGTTGSAMQPTPAARRRTRLVAVGLVVAGVVAGAALAYPVAKGSRAVASESPTIRFTIPAPAGGQFAGDQVIMPLAVSPDGRDIVYVGDIQGRRYLYHRALDAVESRQLPGTEGAQSVTFSGDGWVYYWASDGFIHRQRIESGVAERFGKPSRVPQGISWSATHGLILGMLDGEMRHAGVSRLANGDTAVRDITRPDTGGMHHWPVVIGAGETALFTDLPTRGSSRLVAGSLSTGSWAPLDLEGSALFVVGVANDILVYRSREGRLMAAGFDAATNRVRGAPIPVPGVSGNVNFATLSPSGTLAMLVSADQYEISTVNERGEATPLMPSTRERVRAFYPRLSRDGRALAFGDGAFSERQPTVWAMPNGPPVGLQWRDSRLRIEAIDWLDARTVAGAGSGRLNAQDSAGAAVYALAADAGDSTRIALLLKGRPRSAIGGITIAPDGRDLVLALRPRLGLSSGQEISKLFAARFGADSALTPFAAAAGSQLAPRYSPDGRWIAYASDESGTFEVYVRPAQGGAGPVQVSDHGGGQPVWAHDGKHLFYRTGPAMISAAVSVESGRFVVGRRDQLFSGAFFGGESSLTATYDVFPDGRRFVMAHALGGATGELIVMTGWVERVKAELAGRPK